MKVLIESLVMEPYASVICYPRSSGTELERRIGELRAHGVASVEFAGEVSAFNLPVLGKGFVGVVITANLGRQRVALKIRRVDADRAGLQHEAQMLAKANSVHVGSKLIGVSRNFLLMQLVDGFFLRNWLDAHKEKEEVRVVLSKVLEQCWRLDRINLDHGELSNASKHIIISKKQKPFLLDFESASIHRKPGNVTSVCQFLFISRGAVAKAIAEVLGEINSAKVIDALRSYKNDRKRENFDRILQICLA